MTDQDKYKIRPLDEKSDYSLWRLRVRAAISAKGLRTVFVQSRDESDENSDDHGTRVVTASEEQMEQASNIIVSALGDHALRVVRSVIGEPHKMFQKLDMRYDSKSTATRISKMAELVSLKYGNLRDDISKHIDRMAGLLEQLRSMNTVLDDALAIGILVASIEVSELSAVTAAIKTLAEKDLVWEDVSSRLIEECKSIKTSHKDRASAASSVCGLCKKPGHTIDDCFMNPMNPKNRLNLSDKKTQWGKPKSEKHRKKKDRNEHDKNEERAAMARPSYKSRKGQAPDRMLLDSGTTSHMTALSNKVHSKDACDVTIKLADDSTVKASSTGVRTVHWMTDTGKCKVKLSETLVAEDVAISLLSVPALARKNIATLFMPEKALLIDLEADCAILGQATKDKDGLYYIADRQDQPLEPLSHDESKAYCAMRASIVARGAQDSESGISGNVSDESDDGMSDAGGESSE